MVVNPVCKSLGRFLPRFSCLEVQWNGLRGQAALADAGIAHQRLSTAQDIFARTAILEGFQERTAPERVPIAGAQAELR